MSSAQPPSSDGTGPNTPKRTPAPRKRPARPASTEPIAPEGEAPEILDAMLGSAPVLSPEHAGQPVPPDEPAQADLPEVKQPEAKQSDAKQPDAQEPHIQQSDAQETDSRQTDTQQQQEVPVATDEAKTHEPTRPASPTDVSDSAAAEVSASGATTPASDARTDDPVSDEPTADRVAGDPAGTSPETGAGMPLYSQSVSDLADRLDDSRFFSSLFDFTFTSYVTRKLAGPVYVVGLVLTGLGVLVGLVNSLSIAIATNSPAGAFVFLLGVLVTLVAAVLSVLLLRVTIEVFCAIIEIAQNTRPRRRTPRK